jgi:RecA/RadA recombinase
MNSTSVSRSNFASDFYHAAFCTKCPDDIYINQQLGNFLDSNCTHFEQKNTQFEEKAQEYRQKKKQQQRRHYLKWTDVEVAADSKYRNYGEGITYKDILKRFPGLVKTSKQAQNILRNYKNKSKLYTCHRTKPQKYFLSNDHAELAALNYRKSTHSDPTGVKSSHSSSPNGHSSSTTSRAPLTNVLEHIKTHDFYHALVMLKIAPLAMHNIRLYLKLADPTRYDIIPTHYEEENRAKVLRRRKGHVHTTYKIYPHGAVDIFIKCSKAAFPIETDSDVTELFSFIGGVYNTLQDWLRDMNAHIVPPIKHWRLVHADINKDVKVPERLHLTVPNMELSVVDRVFRMYVKSLGHVSVLRVEEMMMFNEAIGDAVGSLRKGGYSASTSAVFTHSLNPVALIENVELKRKIAMLTSQMAEMQEMIVESRKLPAQEIRLKKETTSSGQIVVYDDEKEESFNTENSEGINDDSHKQTSSSNRLSIITTNSTKAENKEMEILELHQQQEHQPIAIPSSASAPNEDAPIISSAAELLEQRINSNNHLKISTGSKRLDDLLGGGIERGAVTEISGRTGSGKTPLCLTLSVTAQQQEQEKASVDYGCETTIQSTRVLFIDTGRSFDNNQLISIAQARGLDSDAVVDSIAVERIHDFRALEEFIEKQLDEFLKKNPDTLLVIVDSIMALQPMQRKGGKEEYLSLWQESLDSLMYSLQRAALQYNTAVVVINDNDKTVVSDYPFGRMQVPEAQNIILHAITHRLSFKNHGGYKVAKIVHSSCYPESEVPFTINGQGITDIQP